MVRSVSEVPEAGLPGAGFPGDLPGVDLAALARWLDAHHPDLRVGELTGTVLAGGKSNLTYRISDGASTWALRRPPLAHVLPTAHDMSREYRVISALDGTAVPVPVPVALCADPEVLGAPFYLMGFVDGVVLDHPEALAAVTPADARGVCEQLIDRLLDLHAVEPTSVGLADFGRPEGFLARQLDRWHRQWVASETAPRSQLEPVVAGLGRRLPNSPAPAIVHGDYRLTNVMFRRDLTAIAAVVDWEMATLGDPFTDVGLLVVYQTLAAAGDFVMPHLAEADGFLSADALVARYRDGSLRELAELDWYVAFGYFKLAVVAEGIHHRYLQGMTVGPGFDHFGPAVPGLLDAALQRLDGP
jgi:aminoglycoside phosphotransferase (APT) family kinase protein